MVIRVGIGLPTWFVVVLGAQIGLGYGGLHGGCALEVTAPSVMNEL